jgi:hypothetical protein
MMIHHSNIFKNFSKDDFFALKKQSKEVWNMSGYIDLIVYTLRFEPASSGFSSEDLFTYVGRSDFLNPDTEIIPNSHYATTSKQSQVSRTNTISWDYNHIHLSTDLHLSNLDSQPIFSQYEKELDEYYALTSNRKFFEVKK